MTLETEKIQMYCGMLRKFLFSRFPKADTQAWILEILLK